MAVIRYTLDSGSVPSYISDGGHFYNPADNTIIGIGSGGGTTIASKADLNTYVLSVHASYPIKKSDTLSNISDMTNAEVTTLVNNWCIARSIS
tara:strand:+ start:538 stop:816 length:279 start_codon:yes stop_codon:yes gene_type:complete